MIGGGLLAEGSVVNDLVPTPSFAREYNEAHGLSARVTPTVGPGGGQVDFALRAAF